MVGEATPSTSPRGPLTFTVLWERPSVARGSVSTQSSASCLLSASSVLLSAGGAGGEGQAPFRYRDWRPYGIPTATLLSLPRVFAGAQSSASFLLPVDQPGTVTLAPNES